ncbi:MAG: hypothetical protein IT169_02045 [Bryobacterales bacterium]|nr:hypothetical protein [Bryobacterales bacterium]
MPNSRQDDWAPKLARNRERDKSNVKALRRLGWRVLVVWECKTSNPGELARRLARLLGDPA